MGSELKAISYQGKQEVNWIEAVLFLTDRKYLDRKKIKQLNDRFGKLKIAAPFSAPESLTDISWHEYDSVQPKSLIWNSIVDEAELPWILFTEDDEQLRFSSLPGKKTLSAKKWTPAIIKNEEDGNHFQYYQMRLVNREVAQSANLFAGKNLPDATNFIRSNEIGLVDQPILFERESSPIDHVDIDEELSIKTYAPKLFLVQGKRYYEKKKYVHAAAQYRQLLKKEKLLPFDRLAGVNGLASCMAEQHKWQKALSLTKQSLEADPFQRLPYLIQFRIYELRKEWQKAYVTLKKYYERLSLNSSANFDRYMKEEKSLVKLADAGLKAGHRSDAIEYFNVLFTFKRGNADRNLLQKALLLSIELGNFERSVNLFERLFGNVLPPNDMDEAYREELDDTMTMFMKKEWYEYVSTIYTKLHNAYPDDRDYKRKLIVTLSKTNRLDQAKTMVANIV